MNLHVRHARFTVRVVHVRGTETTLDISAGGLMLDRQGMSGPLRVALDLPGGHGSIAD